MLYFTKVLSSPILCVIVFSKCEQPYIVNNIKNVSIMYIPKLQKRCVFL